MRRIAVGAAIVLCTLILASPAGAQPDAGAANPLGALEELPWAIRLGARVDTLDRAVPVVDRVVLVPDGATYLDEIGRWSPRGRWPVLLEDDHFAPIFLQRFRPRQVVRRQSVGALPADRVAHRKACEAVVVSAFGGDPGVFTVAGVFERAGFRPPGLILASTDDPAWTAAVALAAGRGQLLHWHDGGLPHPDEILQADAALELADIIRAGLDAQPWSYAALGDDVETITICRSLAMRIASNPYPRSVIRIPGARTDGAIATSDLLGRHPGGRRFAFCGLIFGDEIRCAYTAMCSLFLPRQRVWMLNGYPDSGQWQAYDMTPATNFLRTRGYRVEVRSGDNAATASWAPAITGGIATDLLVINSKGMVDFFDLYAGTAFPQDVPVLNTPAALQMVHSWSLRSPETLDTVGGRWLDRGVYAYVGASQEPYLTAFVTPDLLVRRLASHVPLLIAARHWTGPFSAPWRVSTYGDPLMLVATPRQPIPPRVQLDVEEGADIAAGIAERMRRADDRMTDTIAAEVLRDLTFLGRDSVAWQFWMAARDRGVGAAAARAALGPLFRTRREEAFIDAWRRLPEWTPRERDMLWHLLSPRLGHEPDDQTLLLLADHLREPRLHIDLRRLAPHIERSLGRGHLLQLIDRAAARATPAVRKELDTLRSPGNS